MLAEQIKQKAIELGYVGCGIIPANAFAEYTKALDERVKVFPGSKELYDYFYNFTNQPTGAKSVIVCTQRFNKYKPVESLNGLIAKCYQYDCRISYSQDYRAKDEFDNYLKTCGLSLIDTTVPDRWAAVKAGLAKFGRNNFAYDPVHGSNIWIETWVVDQELSYNELTDDLLLPGCNAGCDRCMKACPTKALSDEFTMDMGKCITYLFCHSSDAPDRNLEQEMQQWLYGCDVCQDVCPHNHDKYKESEEFPLLENHAEYLTLERILEMDEETYQNIVNPRFWYVGKDGLWLWKYNALRAMINSGEEKYHRIIEEYCNHEDSRLRELARQIRL